MSAGPHVELDGVRRAQQGVDPSRFLVGLPQTALVEEMQKAGVLAATGGLTSTKKGARIRFEGGKHTVIDGPFAESKELVAGYAILEVPSKEEAIRWSIEFGEIVGVNEIEVRQMPEW